MQTMRFFMDTHNRSQETFPKQLSPAQFQGFFADYQKACAAEGVVPLRTHVSFGDGRAFCFSMAPDADAVRRAHARAGLPFDSITEVMTVSPSDLSAQVA